MFNELTKLYNTLMLIETRGENTKIMAQCLQYIEQLIAMSNARAETSNTKESDISEDRT